MEDKYNRHHLVIQPSTFQYKGTDPDEPIVCSHFGCNIHLNPTNQLFGTKCINHQNKKQVPDASRYVSYPINKKIA